MTYRDAGAFLYCHAVVREYARDALSVSDPARDYLGFVR
jgi:hypothetical protein